ncbi:MAG TPA: SulP family inorganic anion transporter, partial [Candidatus Bathyarchaeia archaeon]|nr:SulP family inorganic anion transporter [Candidatus Bathyarchaeia archaeon]
MLTIPVSMGYGVLALSPLGDQYVSYGILAGLFTAIFVPLTALILGDRTGLMYAPRSVVTFLITSIVAQTLARFAPEHVDAARVLTVAFAVIFLGGAFQALFGILRIGSIIRYIPSPVMAGFQNAVAALIFLSQLGTLLGLPRGVAPLQVIGHPSLVRAPTALVGLLTYLAIWGSPRLTKRIPPIVIGFAVGTGTFYLLAVAGYGAGLGPVIGAMPHADLLPKYLGEFAGFLSDPVLRAILPTVILGALSLAIIGSLDGLLCAKTVASAAGVRAEGNRVLTSLGSGNMVAACFGGIAGGLNLGSTFANIKAGGRTWISVAVSVTLLALAVLLLGPVIAFIPRVVIAGILL